MAKQTITLYRNGLLRDNGIPISFSHRKYDSVGAFVAYINDELKVAKKKYGYKYMFTTDGDEVRSMDDIQYGKSYVLAFKKTFIPAEYDEQEYESDEGTRNNSRSKSRDSRNNSRNKEVSDVRDDEKEAFRAYSYRREKTRQRNLDRHVKDRGDNDEDRREYSDNGEDEIEIMIYRNGIYSDPGSYINVDKSVFRNSRFVTFINYLNEQMQLLGLSTGIRHVYTVNGDEIRRVDDIRNKRRYVAGGGRFIKLAYGERPLHLKGKRRAAKTRKRRRKRRSEREETQEGPSYHNSDIEVRVFKNGEYNDPGKKVSVPADKLQTVEEFLGHIKHEVDLRSAQFVYHDDGSKIRSMRQVSDRDKVVVAAGKFIGLRYGEQSRRMKRIKRKVAESKSSRDTGKDSERGGSRRSYSDGDTRRRYQESPTESSTDPYSANEREQRSDDTYSASGTESESPRRRSRSSDRGKSSGSGRSRRSSSGNRSRSTSKNNGRARGRSGRADDRGRGRGGRDGSNDSRIYSSRERIARKQRQTRRSSY